MQNGIKFLTILLIGLSGLFISCEKDNNEPEDSPNSIYLDSSLYGLWMNPQAFFVTQNVFIVYQYEFCSNGVLNGITDYIDSEGNLLERVNYTGEWDTYNGFLLLKSYDPKDPDIVTKTIFEYRVENDIIYLDDGNSGYLVKIE